MRPLRRRVTLTILALAALVLAAPAIAAVKDGTYKGTSSGKIEVRVADPTLGSTFKNETDKGKVSFSVKRGAIKSFTLTGQKAMCGPSPQVVDIKLAKLTMSGATGKGTYTHPALGPQKVTVKLGSKGAATGTITFGGLCRAATATFSARIG